MKKLLTVGAVAMLALGAFADAASQMPAGLVNNKPVERKKLAELKYKRNGPMLTVPNAAVGKIVYVNAQKRVSAADLNAHAEVFRLGTDFKIEVADGTFEFPNPKIQGSASLFIIDDENMPTILSAPEAKWCVVNVAPLAKDGGDKPAFFNARVQKELTRGFAILAGAQTSNYPQSLMGCVTKPRDLDKFVDCRLPVDVPARFAGYVEGYGVKPEVKVSYRKACEEGWAPQPTNDVMRVIWEEYHSKPTEPMRIKFDPKLGE